MQPDQLIVFGDLDLESRRLFIACASGAIDKADRKITLDCSHVDALDAPTLGMLVTIARFAQRRGQRVALDGLSKRARADLDDAGVSDMFDGPV